jgi:hypothetical protein
VTAALFRFVALPLREQARTVEAALWLLVVRAAFALLPLRRALRLFRITEGEGSTGRIAAPAAAAVGRAITRAARCLSAASFCRAPDVAPPRARGDHSSRCGAHGYR